VLQFPRSQSHHSLQHRTNLQNGRQGTQVVCDGQSHRAETRSNARELSAEAWRNVFENNDLLCGFLFREQCQDVIRARLNGETLDRNVLVGR